MALGGGDAGWACKNLLWFKRPRSNFAALISAVAHVTETHPTDL